MFATFWGNGFNFQLLWMYVTMVVSIDGNGAIMFPFVSTLEKPI